MKNQSAVQRGFTLLEVVLTISVLTLIVVIAVLVVNPAERIREARDSTRLSDVRAISAAVSLMESDISGGVANFDYDGPLFAADDSCAGQANPRIFVSVPSDNGETAPAPPSGWEYAQVLGANIAEADGDGWLPIDFTQNANEPLDRLPVDPTNRFDEGLYYSYVCGGSFEVNAALESDKFIEEITGDGGDSSNLFEAGSTLTIAPERPVIAANESPALVSVTHAPDPVDDGSDITFTIEWTDDDDTEVSIYVCGAGGITAGTGCNGDEWVSAPTTTNGTTDLAYTATSSDVGTSPNNYYVYVCDDTPECSDGQSGQFNVETVATASSETSLPDDTPIIDGYLCQPPSDPMNGWSSDESVPTNYGQLAWCTGTPSDGEYVRLNGYSLNSVSGTIDGVIVELDNVSIEESLSGNQHFEVRLSWDGGTSWTSACSTPDIVSTTLSGANYYCAGSGTATTTDPGAGGATTWGRTWTSGDFSNLVVEVKSVDPDSNFLYFYFDVAEVTVHYTN